MASKPFSDHAHLAPLPEQKLALCAQTICPGGRFATMASVPEKSFDLPLTKAIFTLHKTLSLPVFS
jgi:hypothetical protein